MLTVVLSWIEFIMVYYFSGFILAGIFGMYICCYMTYKNKSEYGLLSQNGYDEDLKDLNESNETEIFCTPLKGKFL